MTHPDQSDSVREVLQRDLLTVFERYGVNVAVGLTRHGVAIRSQDERVDAANVGAVRARLASDEDCPACGAPAGYPPGGPCENHGTPEARLTFDEEGS